MQDERGKPAASWGCLLRLFWMIAGNFCLAVVALLIADRCRKALSFSALDGVYWAVAALLVVVRYVDIRHMGGATATGEPASMRHFGRYAAILAVASTLLWAAAHVLGQARG